jgi:hypothetical protein
LRGFFNATQQRVLARRSWRALKKPNTKRRFVLERLWVKRDRAADIEQGEMASGKRIIVFLVKRDSFPSCPVLYQTQIN